MTDRTEDRFCDVCGRRIEWRRKWAHDWQTLRFCSRACRRQGLDDTDTALEAAILDVLAGRGRGQTVCPSEAAREFAPTDWKPLMERVRRAARRLVVKGKVDIMQKGRVVDASTARGPVRIRSRR